MAEKEDRHPYGAGSHGLLVDEREMPDCYPIKGNVRNDGSKRYHRPDSRNYRPTIPEVWFDSPLAAEAAGFELAPTHPKGSNGDEFEPGQSGHPCTAAQIASIRQAVDALLGGSVGAAGADVGLGAVAVDSVLHPFGVGSHALLSDEREMPGCYPIKGNIRNDESRLYHRPDSRSYGPTVAGVWFDSPAAAEAAGFGLAPTHPQGSTGTEFEPGGSGHPCTAEQISGLRSAAAGTATGSGDVDGATDEADEGDADHKSGISGKAAAGAAGVAGAAALAGKAFSGNDDKNDDVSADADGGAADSTDADGGAAASGTAGVAGAADSASGSAEGDAAGAGKDDDGKSGVSGKAAAAGAVGAAGLASAGAAALGGSGDDAADAAGKAGDAASAAAGKAGDVAGKAGEAASGVTGKVGGAAGTASSKAKDAASKASGTAGAAANKGSGVSGKAAAAGALGAAGVAAAVGGAGDTAGAVGGAGDTAGAVGGAGDTAGAVGGAGDTAGAVSGKAGSKASAAAGGVSGAAGRLTGRGDDGKVGGAALAGRGADGAAGGFGRWVWMALALLALVLLLGWLLSRCGNDDEGNAAGGADTEETDPEGPSDDGEGDGAAAGVDNEDATSTTEEETAATEEETTTTEEETAASEEETTTTEAATATTEAPELDLQALALVALADAGFDDVEVEVVGETVRLVGSLGSEDDKAAAEAAVAAVEGMSTVSNEIEVAGATADAGDDEDSDSDETPTAEATDGDPTYTG